MSAQPSNETVVDVSADIIIVGGGFSGCYALFKLRLMGYTVKILEASTGFGGVWRMNRYPGARVDSQTPTYQLSLPEVWEDFNFSELYPDHHELRRYFDHMDKVLDLQKDTYFNTRVQEVKYNQEKRTWSFKAHGLTATSTYAIFAVGSSCEPYIPDWPGKSNFKGQIIHPASWPENFETDGKRIGVIGQGASGIQIVQELAKENCELSVFIRTPSMCFPMNQRAISTSDSDYQKGYYDAILDCAKYNTEDGYPFNHHTRCWRDETEAERQRLYERLWKRGGFGFLVSNYPDLLTNKASNASAYNFWVQKIRERIRDPVKRDILAPTKQPYWMGAKRPSLEQDYYESVDRPNVTLIDLKKSPIQKFTEEGIVTEDDDASKLWKLDVIVVATGYDNLTGSLFKMNIHNKEGVKLQDTWKNGIRTHLGMSVPGFPNAFFLYAPQAPSSLANGPPFIELQVNWLAQLFERIRNDKVELIEASEEAASIWKTLIGICYENSLSAETNSWWVGANIPGKKHEPLVWFGGIKSWWDKCQSALQGWEDSGFLVRKNEDRKVQVRL
ncbi:hypothetical protein COCC4DRAFT_45917 [Bipolaris maydis ATCC 48331]|uniref:FAD/NAD(P)-binding domain-containing protein n=2 Tax=Cochliobolus heterostrophus TaxID=5016 RepID=M2UWM6_COCH5|nr:uncharacterized protein COCC4DRAFT_45917 [Bipolaris maydis ATCC 48331]EMD97941.1 hypothetical protein COCHEDRAFT_1209707 [Bipolaris maydis C5]KAJ5031995.1 hypothetical protein J3E73DRAFT_178426 [Bipolaris maydis]ENH98604.1 hypothetical protein COCC4DRAFT_45917 [Bipolaris maydis ATCC 48331]KAJ5046927.1 hypothetical protein J3E74DRAFT_296111 [Bipolaris maydis]KAJ5059944.1 hypothetical protein J3E74DRAFT_215151 [Bipolaris maydis]